MAWSSAVEKFYELICRAGEAGDEHGAEDGGQVEEVDGGEQEADPPGDQPRPTSCSSREQVDCWTRSGGRAAPAPETFLKYRRSDIFKEWISIDPAPQV